MAKVNNSPARYEGPYSHLGALIRKEAAYHLATALQYEQAHPAECGQPDDDATIRCLNIEQGIWQMLVTGWARVTKDWESILFWEPVACEFVPWSNELNLVLIGIAKQIRPVVDAYIGDASAEIPASQGGDYTGGGVKKKGPVLVFDDTKTSGQLH
jgi:hypothetical protein